VPGLAARLPGSMAAVARVGPGGEGPPTAAPPAAFRHLPPAVGACRGGRGP